MHPDVALVVAIVAAALGFMKLVSDYSHSSPPRMAALLGVVSGSMLLYAVANNPSGYTMADVPGAFVRVFAQAAF